VRELGPAVPIHFTAFHPDYKFIDVPPTPSATLERARHIALERGIQHVYCGNVHDIEGDTTFCSGCKKPLIVRDWYEILEYHLQDDGTCPHCGTRLAGRFGKFEKAFGGKRIPIAIRPKGI
jgi:pyruvate formate lyase activating enzyme